MLLLVRRSLCCFLVVLIYSIAILASDNDNNNHLEHRNPYAMIVTLAGTSKLSTYFEWTCRSIGHAAQKFDMLVFHESNIRLREISCASNVKFIDVGENGMAKLIVTEVLSEFNATNEGNRGDLINALSEVMINIPRYLIEVKPMTGALFRDYLQGYTHWTYTDPDIVWGNIADWIDPVDAATFDIITLAKNNDAGRLFIRGQFALHKNIPRVNYLWKELFFFAPSVFASRVTKAVVMIRQKKSSDTVFQTNFHSAEGYYSQLVFKRHTLVKIIGRGYDDFNKDPVIVTEQGQLTRCQIGQLQKVVGEIVQNTSAISRQSFSTMPPLVPVDVKTYFHKNACYMQWLPSKFRYCIATPVYSKENTGDNPDSPNIRLMRLSESFTADGVNWQVNNDRQSNRQIKNGAAMFHFRHWDDFCTTGLESVWPSGDKPTLSCMVVYIRSDSVLTFESCDSVLHKFDAGTFFSPTMPPAQLAPKDPIASSRDASKEKDHSQSPNTRTKDSSGAKRRRRKNGSSAKDRKSSSTQRLRGSKA